MSTRDVSVKQSPMELKLRADVANNVKRYKEMVKNDMPSGHKYLARGEIVRAARDLMNFYESRGDLAKANQIRGIYKEYGGHFLDLRASSPAVASILSLLGALFFISLNLTGNAVSVGITEGSSKIVGLLLFVCGLVFALLHFKKGRFKF